MGQVTIYLDDETEAKLNNAVNKSGISKSKWIAERIKENALSVWPESVKELAGSWRDFPSVEEIRADMGNDVEREPV